ncbi:MAG: GNAT family N-acetyltransferase [Croceibacterium sp.]
MAEVILQTTRLHLRRWEDGDLALWQAHLNTPQVKQHLGGVQDAEQVAASFARARQAWDEDGFSFLPVERAEDGLFLGMCGLARIQTESAPAELRDAIQIGWQLRSDCWGQGYATEAAAAMLDFGFSRFDWPVIVAQTSENNIGSWRVMQRLGLRRRAELDYVDPDYPPQDNPTMIWSIAREERPAA